MWLFNFYESQFEILNSLKTLEKHKKLAVTPLFFMYITSLYPISPYPEYIFSEWNSPQPKFQAYSSCQIYLKWNPQDHVNHPIGLNPKIPITIINPHIDIPHFDPICSKFLVFPDFILVIFTQIAIVYHKI